MLVKQKKQRRMGFWHAFWQIHRKALELACIRVIVPLLNGSNFAMTEADNPDRIPVNKARKERKASAAEERQARLAEALRQNLRRRKGQAKDRKDD